MSSKLILFYILLCLTTCAMGRCVCSDGESCKECFSCTGVEVRSNEAMNFHENKTWPFQANVLSRSQNNWYTTEMEKSVHKSQYHKRSRFHIASIRGNGRCNCLDGICKICAPCTPVKFHSNGTWPFQTNETDPSPKNISEENERPIGKAQHFDTHIISNMVIGMFSVAAFLILLAFIYAWRSYRLLEREDRLIPEDSGGEDNEGFDDLSEEDIEMTEFETSA